MSWAHTHGLGVRNGIKKNSGSDGINRNGPPIEMLLSIGSVSILFPFEVLMAHIQAHHGFNAFVKVYLDYVFMNSISM